MEQHIYNVELGVIKEPPDDQWELFRINGFFDDVGFELKYTRTYFDKQSAVEIAEKYIEEGVEKSYALLYDYDADLDDDEIDDILENQIYEFSCDFKIEDITDLIYKVNGTVRRKELNDI